MKKFACLIGLLFMGSANATPIEWTLNNVTFDDGTAVTGSYFYDADTNAWSDWEITVSAGTLSAFTYTDLNSQTNSTNESSLGFLYVDNAYSRYINFNFLGAMTNLGGTIDLELANTFTNFQTGSWECNNCGTMRWITGGSVSSVSVSEPAAFALLGLGLAGIGFSRKKKAA